MLHTAKEWLRKSLSLYMRGRESIPILLGPLRGKLLPRETGLRHLEMLFGRYELPVVSAVLALSPAKVAYDVGAHVGYISLALAVCVGEGGLVVAFEPDPSNRALAERLVLQNKLGQVVRVIPKALGSTNGRERLLVEEPSFMCFLESAWRGQRVANGQMLQVETSTLDRFVFQESNPSPEILKIDVEGAEAQVLEGGMRTLETFSPVLLLEIHGPGNARKCWRLLQGMNYRWQRLAPVRREFIASESQLLSLFSKYARVHHFVLTRLEEEQQRATGFSGVS